MPESAPLCGNVVPHPPHLLFHTPGDIGPLRCEGLLESRPLTGIEGLSPSGEQIAARDRIIDRLERMVYRLAEEMMSGHTWEGAFGEGPDEDPIVKEIMAVHERITPIVHAEWEASPQGQKAAKQREAERAHYARVNELKKQKTDIEAELDRVEKEWP